MIGFKGGTAKCFGYLYCGGGVGDKYEKQILVLKSYIKPIFCASKQHCNN